MPGWPYRTTAMTSCSRGGMLLASLVARRPTTDADAPARNMAADEQTVVRRVVDIASIPILEDGVQFDVSSVRAQQIRSVVHVFGVGGDRAGGYSEIVECLLKAVPDRGDRDVGAGREAVGDGHDLIVSAT